MHDRLRLLGLCVCGMAGAILLYLCWRIWVSWVSAHLTWLDLSHRLGSQCFLPLLDQRCLVLQLLCSCRPGHRRDLGHGLRQRAYGRCFLGCAGAVAGDGRLRLPLKLSGAFASGIVALGRPALPARMWAVSTADVALSGVWPPLHQPSCCLP